MERRQIEYFVALAEHRSFTAAAAALFVSQPALSQSIRALERDLGAELVRRLSHGVELTSAGRAFEVAAQQILRDFGNARAAVDAVTELLGGELDIATLPALTLEPLGAVIGEFRTQHEHVRLRFFQPEAVDQVLDMVHRGKAEIGLIDIALPPQFESELVAVSLGEQQLFVAFPPNMVVPANPLPIERMLELPLITGRRGTFVRDFVLRHSKDLDYEPDVVIQLERRESAVQLVLVGAGVAIVPTPLAQVARDYGATIVPTEPPMWRVIRLVRRPGTLSPAATKFVEILLAKPRLERPATS